MRIQVKNENGSVVVEFIGLLLLLILPLVSYFTVVAVHASSLHKDKEIFREVIQIFRSESSTQEAANLADRYLVLRGVSGSITVSCKSGNCPQSDSVIEIQWRQPSRVLLSTVKKGNWQ